MEKKQKTSLDSVALDKSKIPKSNIKENVNNALFKKAVGFEQEEIMEEYGIVDGELTLTKKKVTKKYSPPDVSAINKILEISENDENLIKTMSIEDLKKQKLVLMEELEKINKEK